MRNDFALRFGIWYLVPAFGSLILLHADTLPILIPCARSYIAFNVPSYIPQLIQNRMDFILLFLLVVIDLKALALLRLEFVENKMK